MRKPSRHQLPPDFFLDEQEGRRLRRQRRLGAATNLTDKLTGPVEGSNGRKEGSERSRSGAAEKNCCHSMKSTVSDETIAATIRVIRSFVRHATQPFCRAPGTQLAQSVSPSSDATCTPIVVAVIASIPSPAWPSSAVTECVGENEWTSRSINYIGTKFHLDFGWSFSSDTSRKEGGWSLLP